jgi:hypothetical protein
MMPPCPTLLAFFSRSHHHRSIQSRPVVAGPVAIPVAVAKPPAYWMAIPQIIDQAVPGIEEGLAERLCRNWYQAAARS